MDNVNNLGLTTSQTLNLTEEIQPGERAETIGKSITTSNYLYGYPLEKPAKKLYFIEDTLRRRIPRKLSQEGGSSAHWKQITRLNSNNVKAGVAEGAVASAMSITTAERSMPYKTLNMYNAYTDESRVFGRKFEDIPALGMLTTLQSLMIQEDIYDFGGNTSQISAPSWINLEETSSGGSLVGGTKYYVSVTALTIFGWQHGQKGRKDSVDCNDMTNGTSDNITTAATTTALKVTWNDVPGAFAYNVYISTTSGDERYYDTVFSNYAELTHYSSSTASPYTPNTANHTADPYAYDGVLPQLIKSDSGAYYKSLNNAQLTSDNAGGIMEIENMLESIWNNFRVSPTVIFMNARESKTVKSLSLSGGNNSTRITISQDAKNRFTAGAAVNTYWSPYQEQLIELKTSVHCPPGKIIALGETIPYPDSEVANNLEMDLQQDYYGEIYARTQRTTPIGVSMIGALKCYLPGACGIISNIGA